jgi:hypothetical protein
LKVNEQPVCKNRWQFTYGYSPVEKEFFGGAKAGRGYANDHSIGHLRSLAILDSST